MYQKKKSRNLSIGTEGIPIDLNSRAFGFDDLDAGFHFKAKTYLFWLFMISRRCDCL